MPRNIASYDAVLVEHHKRARIIKTGRAHRGAPAPWTKLIKRTLAAGEEREITRLLRSQEHGHDFE